MDRKKIIATGLLEQTNFALLREWGEFQRDTLLADLAAADPNKPGDLAALHGRARELSNFLNLETRVKAAAQKTDA